MCRDLNKFIRRERRLVSRDGRGPLETASYWAPSLARDNRLRLFSFRSLFNCPRVPTCMKNSMIILVTMVVHRVGWMRHLLMCGDLSRDYKWREL